MSSIRRVLPFSASTTPTQAVTYLLGISLFSISFLVFLNSSVSFVVTDLIGQKDGVGDIVGTLGFADELVALVACPVWGLVSDRLGVRWVAVLGYGIVGCALVLFVQAKNVYPELLLARVFFAVGGSATATMVTAILPTLTDDATDEHHNGTSTRRASSSDSEATITPEFQPSTSLPNSNSRRPSSVAAGAHTTRDQNQRNEEEEEEEEKEEEEGGRGGKPSVLAGYVGLFTGCGALLALSLFLPLPARFGQIDGVTSARAVEYSFYVVGVAALLVAVVVSVGLRDIKAEEGKGWRLLLGLKRGHGDHEDEESHMTPRRAIPYLHLLKTSVRLGFTDPRIALGYLGGFVARASTVAISLFIPLFVNTFFIRNGFCQGSPQDPSPELKKECREAYVLSSILTGVAQLMGLICAPLFGHSASRLGTSARVNYPVIVATVFGICGYIALPRLSSPEIKNVDGRGGSPFIFLIVSLIGISQIGSIVCSLGSLGRGILAVDNTTTNTPHNQQQQQEEAQEEEQEEGRGEEHHTENEPLIRLPGHRRDTDTSRVRLKGSISGVYSLCGGAAILLLTKIGGLLFDKWSNGVPFYMMAVFNAVLLVASLFVDASHAFATY